MLIEVRRTLNNKFKAVLRNMTTGLIRFTRNVYSFKILFYLIYDIIFETPREFVNIFHTNTISKKYLYEIYLCVSL